MNEITPKQAQMLILAILTKEVKYLLKLQLISIIAMIILFIIHLIYILNDNWMFIYPFSISVTLHFSMKRRFKLIKEKHILIDQIIGGNNNGSL